MTSIAAERQLYQQVGFDHRLRSEWGARFKLRNSAGVLVDGYTIARPVDEPATRLFAHISVTNPASYATNDAHARAIEAIGISRFPNTGVSYNELILPGGKPYEAQPMGRRGAHTVNDEQRTLCNTPGCPSNGSALTAPSWNLNVNSRACCFARDVDDPITDADIDAAARWAAAGKLTGMVHSSARWHGHRCVSSKDCPGNRVWVRMDDLADLTADYVRNGDLGMALTDDDIAKIKAMEISDQITEEAGDTVSLGALLANDRGRLYDMKVQVNDLVQDVESIKTTVESLSVAGVDYDLLASKTADLLAQRLQS